VTRTRRVGRLGLGAAALALFVFVPGVPPLCPMRWILHVPCPGCGMTRAAALALTGHFAEATRMHPLWFFVLPLLALAASNEAIVYVRADGRQSVVADPKAFAVAGGIVALMTAVWIARFFGMFGGPAPV
jgi:hypothetical protein